MDYSFRIGRSNDLDQIMDVTKLAYMQYGQLISKEYYDVWMKNLLDENTYVQLLEMAYCFVCEYKKCIVGSSFLIPRGNPYKWFQQDWAYIRLVAVHPNYEGQGIGRKITQMCIDKAIETGEKVIALHTAEFQNTARHIYESMGFVKIEDLELMFGKQYYLYCRKLD